MPAYLIVETDIHDPEQYEHYKAASPGAVAAGGGRFLVRGGELAVLEGDWQPKRLVVLEFESLDAAKRFPRIFLDLANNLSDAQLWALAALAMTYSIVRFAEAYGLWFERRWGEWIAALSGGIYVPFEIYELSRGFSAIKLGALILNAVIVAYMCHLLWRRAKAA